MVVNNISYISVTVISNWQSSRHDGRRPVAGRSNVTSVESQPMTERLSVGGTARRELSYGARLVNTTVHERAVVSEQRTPPLPTRTHRTCRDERVSEATRSDRCQQHGRCCRCVPREATIRGKMARKNTDANGFHSVFGGEKLNGSEVLTGELFEDEFR